jgi:two-component system LytT family response regulator
MTEIRAIIVDDEDFARDILFKLIEHYCPEIKIVGQANTVDSAIDLIKLEAPDLLFLDIHLGDEISFDIFENINTHPFEIIFTSAHAQYGVKAFKVEAIDYLMKPIDSDDLIQAVQKVIKKKSLLTIVESEISINIPIHIRDIVENVSSLEISSLVAQSNYTEIYTQDGKKLISSKTLGELEELLKEDSNFVRIHRSVIINTRFVLNYAKVPPLYITMKNGGTYEISRRKKSEVLNHLKNNV